MFLVGLSKPTLSIISERHIALKISPMDVGNAGKGLTDAVDAWRELDLPKEWTKYLFVVETLFSSRIDGSVEKDPILVVIGTRLVGRRTAPAVQALDSKNPPLPGCKNFMKFPNWNFRP